MFLHLSVLVNCLNRKADIDILKPKRKIAVHHVLDTVITPMLYILQLRFSDSSNFVLAGIFDQQNVDSDTNANFTFIST